MNSKLLASRVVFAVSASALLASLSATAFAQVRAVLPGASVPTLRAAFIPTGSVLSAGLPVIPAAMTSLTSGLAALPTAAPAAAASAVPVVAAAASPAASAALPLSYRVDRIVKDEIDTPLAARSGKMMAEARALAAILGDNAVAMDAESLAASVVSDQQQAAVSFFEEFDALMGSSKESTAEDVSRFKEAGETIRQIEAGETVSPARLESVKLFVEKWAGKPGESQDDWVISMAVADAVKHGRIPAHSAEEAKARLSSGFKAYVEVLTHWRELLARPLPSAAQSAPARDWTPLPLNEDGTLSQEGLDALSSAHHVLHKGIRVAVLHGDAILEGTLNLGGVPSGSGKYYTVFLDDGKHVDIFRRDVRKIAMRRPLAGAELEFLKRYGTPNGDWRPLALNEDGSLGQEGRDALSSAHHVLHKGIRVAVLHGGEIVEGTLNRSGVPSDGGKYYTVFLDDGGHVYIFRRDVKKMFMHRPLTGGELEFQEKYGG